MMRTPGPDGATPQQALAAPPWPGQGVLPEFEVRLPDGGRATRIVPVMAFA